MIEYFILKIIFYSIPLFAIASIYDSIRIRIARLWIYIHIKNTKYQYLKFNSKGGGLFVGTKNKLIHYIFIFLLSLSILKYIILKSLFYFFNYYKNWIRIYYFYILILTQLK